MPKLPVESQGEGNSTAITCALKSVSGASAGAMAAVMLASGIQPRDAAKFASKFSWQSIADPFGFGGYVKGNKFEAAMRKFLMENAKTRKVTETRKIERMKMELEKAKQEGKFLVLSSPPGQLGMVVGLVKEGGVVIKEIDPTCRFKNKVEVGDTIVTVGEKFILSWQDIQEGSERTRSFCIIKKRSGETDTSAANPSAPVAQLPKADDDPIQLEDALVPVAVSGFDLLKMRGINITKGCMAKAARASAGFPFLFQPVSWKDSDNKTLLIDGGIRDGLGFNGLASHGDGKKRIINLVVGDFGFQGPRGIADINKIPGMNAESLVSIAITGTPLCGPWAMKNGPRAVESANKAMAAALDMPMERGTCDNHYVIRVDSSKWLE